MPRFDLDPGFPEELPPSAGRKHLADRLAELQVRRPAIPLLITAALTLVAILFAARLRVLTGFESLLPQQRPSVKERDRVATMVQVLRAFGVDCEELPDGMIVRGKEGALTPATVDSKGDHRIAMTAAVLGLHGSGPTRITDCDCIATSFPRFVGTLRALGARIDVES